MQYVDAENHTWTTDDFFKAMDAVYAHTGQVCVVLFTVVVRVVTREQEPSSTTFTVEHSQTQITQNIQQIPLRT